MVPQMPGIPVKVEHRGIDVGQVVSAWVHQVISFIFMEIIFMKINFVSKQGRMDVVMEINDTSSIEGALGKEFIKRGICPELSLGYHVTMSKSPAGFLRASNKKVVELSIVRKGARDGCFIHGFSDPHPAAKKHKIIV